jgi:uncharacterized protein YprB with RNaseH-like and TPR domain
MLQSISPFDVMFLDIETAPQQAIFEDLSDTEKQLWTKKSELDFYARKNELSPEESYQRAGIYAEFGKIVCISVGILVMKEDVMCLRIKSFYQENEKQLLEEFLLATSNFCKSKNQVLCAHNGKEFDFPYIARRAVINGLALPEVFNLAGKKPWEINHLDTMELWKFGDYKHYTSLSLLAHVFGIPTPKDDIDGSEVYRVFYEENNIKKRKTAY